MNTEHYFGKLTLLAITTTCYASITIGKILVVISMLVCSEGCFDEMCQFFEHCMDIFTKQIKNDLQQKEISVTFRQEFIDSLKFHTSSVKVLKEMCHYFNFILFCTFVNSTIVMGVQLYLIVEVRSVI